MAGSGVSNPIKWEAWRLNLARVLSGSSDQWWQPTEGSKIRNPATQHSDRAWGATQQRFVTPYHLYEHLRRTEPILHDTSDGALRALLALDDQITESSDNPEHIKRVEWLRGWLINELPTRAGKGLSAFKSMLWSAVDYGSFYGSIAVGDVGGMTLPVDIEEVLPFAIQYYYLNRQAMPFFDDGNFAPYGIPFIGDKTITVRMGAKEPWRPYGWGLIASCYRLIYLYNYVYTLATEGMEKHDLPWILAYGPLGSREWLDSIVDSDTRVAGKICYEKPTTEIDPQNPTAMINEGIDDYRVEFKEMTRTSADIFQPWLSKMEEDISFSYTGQSLEGMQATDGTGTFAQSKTHASARARNEAGWVELFKPAIQTIIDRIWLWNFPEDLPPKYDMMLEVDEKLVPTAQDIVTLSDSIDIPQQWARERYGIPEAKQGEALVKRSTPAVSPFQFKALKAGELAALAESIPAWTHDDSQKSKSASQRYALQVARRIMPPLVKDLRQYAELYRGPQLPIEEAKAKVDAKMQPLMDALNEAKQSGDLRVVRKAGIDLVRLTDSIYDASVTGYLAGYHDDGNRIWHDSVASQMGELAEKPSGVTAILTSDEALRKYMEALAHGNAYFTLEDWALASAAIRQRSITFACQSAQTIADDLRGALYRAIDEGLTLEQWQAQVNASFAAAGVTPSSTHYLETVYRTTTQGAYGEGQAALARTEAVDGMVWGYQMICNLGLEDHHAGHLEMHTFAAPKNHRAWTDGWGPGCDFRCGCMRITITNRMAERFGWIGQLEPTVAYWGSPPRIPRPVY